MSIRNEWTTTGWFDSEDDEWFPHLDDVASYKYLVAATKNYVVELEPKAFAFVAEPKNYTIELEPKTFAFVSEPKIYTFEVIGN